MEIKFMKEALKEAQKAFDKDEVPVGAIIVKDNKIIARAFNMREMKQQAIAHAEVLAIEKACKKLKSWRLEDCSLYVTLEPCSMCAGVILQSRIKEVIFGAFDPKGGSLGSNFHLYEIEGFNHYPRVISGMMEEESSTLLKEFFKQKRQSKK